jgi:3-dehydroquinate dehydratase/shikimate dehydrogenase
LPLREDTEELVPGYEETADLGWTIMICVSIARTRHKMMIAEYRAATEQGAELAELRLDYLRRDPDLKRLLEVRGCPVVITCRRPQDGGRFSGSEEQRLLLIRTAIAAAVDYVDLETDIAKKVPRFGKTKRIISYHNFQTTPQNLPAIHQEMLQLDPDIIKMVTTAERPSDNVRMLQEVHKSAVPTVGFCMGDMGIPSRILAGKYGAPFTYAAFNKERLLAPGQLSFEELRHLYDYDRIGTDTEVFAVIGDPVSHSLSPHIHNAAFHAMKMNRVYIPFRVPLENFKTFLPDVEWLRIKGFSVTIPHKEAGVESVQQADGAVRMVGALNTMVRREHGWEGHNTDYRAAMSSLEARLGAQAGEGAALSGKHVLVLGAGGVARAIAFGLMRRGAIVSVTNRNKERGTALARDAGCRFVEWGRRMASMCDILINCTPVGMFPEINETPVSGNFLREGMVVFDTIYNPENTLLVKEARAHGCIVITGVDMFVRQAILQFQIFTEQEAPEELMREVVRRQLSPVTALHEPQKAERNEHAPQ